MKTKILVLIMALMFMAGCGGNGDNGGVQEPKVNEPDEEEVVVVEFDCPELEKIVREELFIEDGDVTSMDMLDLYSLRINKANIKNLKGLEYAKGLNDISIERNDIPLESFEPLSELSSLTSVRFNYSTVEIPITSVKWNNLLHLGLIETNISDIGFLKDVATIEHLTLSRNGIEDISALEKMESLIHLNLSGNEISSIEVLKDKTTIDTIILQDNKISDIEPLGTMKGLETIILSYNPVSNLKPLEDLPKLSELTVYLNHDVKHVIFDHVKMLERKGIKVDYHK